MISVIVPLYNKEETICKTIESVLRQTSSDWELVIIDDGSTDRSRDVVSKYLNDQRILYYYKPNGGVSSARNYGINNASGDWMMYLDADDILLDNCISIFENAISKYDADVYVADYYSVSGQDARLAINENNDRYISCNFKDLLIGRIFLRAGNFVARSTILRQCHFDESLSRYEDMSVILKLLSISRVFYIGTPVMKYVREDGGLSTNYDKPERDFIFHISFQQRGLYEKLLLMNHVYEGKIIYPSYRKVLRRKYHGYYYLSPIVSFLTRVAIRLNF